MDGSMPLLVPHVRGHCRVIPALPAGWGVQGPCQEHFLHPLCLVLPCVCSVSEQIAHLLDLLWKPQLCRRLQTRAWNVLFLFLF